MKSAALVVVVLALLTSGACRSARLDTVASADRAEQVQLGVGSHRSPDIAGRLLAAKTQQIRLGDSRERVVELLGWRTDAGHLGAFAGSLDDPPEVRARYAHPELHFLHWARSGVSVYVDFTLDDRVYGIRYYDDKLPHDGPYRRKRHNPARSTDAAIEGDSGDDEQG